MFVIFKRELRAIFASIKNVACIALLALVTGILFVASNMTAGYADVYSVLSIMTIVLGIVIPVLVCDTFTREKESRVFISSMPIKASGILLGKGLAFFVAVLTAVAPIFVYPIILGLMGGPALGTAYPSIMMFIAFECFMISLSLLFSTLFRKLWKMWVVLYVALVLSFVGGTLAILLPNPINNIVRLISPFKQFDHTVFGTFDLASLFYYLAFTALFLAIASRRAREALLGGRAIHKNVKRALLSVLLAGACLISNIALVFVPLNIRQLDVSANRIYSVSSKTESYLKGLDKEVTIYLINGVGQSTLDNIIIRYSELSDNIKLRQVNTTDDAELLKKYGVDPNTDSIPNYSMIVVSELRHRYVTTDQYFCYPYNGTYISTSVFENAFKQYQMYYQAYVSAGQTNSSEFQQLSQTVQAMTEAYTKISIAAEDAITEAVAYVTADKIPTIYFADGNGEQSTGNRLNLKTDKIPEDATLIIINTPKEDYSEAAVADLLDFTRRGGRLIALTNEANLDMPNLVRLLECYGIEAKRGTLGDGLSAKIDPDNASFATGSFDSIKLDGAYELVSKEIDGIETSPLLTVTLKVTVDDESADTAPEQEGEGGQTSEESNKKEEQSVTKTVGMLAYENDIPKLLWISGGNSFYKTNEELGEYSEENKDLYQSYSNLLSFLQISMLAMKENFDSGLSYPTPRQFSTDGIAVNAGDATLMGTLFIVLYPLALAGGAFMLGYSRKKKSQAALEQSRQA